MSPFRRPALLMPFLGLAACAAVELPPPKPDTLARVAALAPYGCNAETAAALDSQGIGADRIVDLYYTRVTAGGTVGHIVAHNAWVTVAGEPRKFLVNHGPLCQFARIGRD